MKTLSKKELDEALKRIPPNRKDKTCSRCGKNSLGEGAVLRTWDKHIQWLFDCGFCGCETVRVEKI